VSMINIMSNFYIYALMITSFRGFLLSKIPNIATFFSFSQSNTVLTGKYE
jgi:hypothetical protein